MVDLAIASCLEMPHPDTDQPLLSAALAAAGINTEILPWDAPTAAFASAKITLIRSTWNYIHHYPAFLSWADKLDMRLVNPACVVRWNTHKRYLRELDEAGINTVPTVLVPRGSGVLLETLLRHKHWFRAVAKPAVSAGSFATRVVAAGETDATWFAGELTQRDMLVQPFLPQVETSGERALVFIEGQLTHAIRKSPRFSGDPLHASPSPIAVESDEQALAKAALSYVMRRLPCGELLYARVDMLRDDQGVARIMELELVEPCLFFEQNQAAVEPFVTGIKRRLSHLR